MKFVYKIIAFPAMGLFLQSCFVAEKYTAPAVVESKYYRTDSLAQDSVSIAELAWQDFFTDSLLASYIEQGLENNVDIRIALQQINAAEAAYKQAQAAWFPVGNASAQASRQQRWNSGGSMLYELAGALSWEADIWGRIRSTERASQASYLQSVAAHKAVKTRLIAGIASLYYQLLSLDEQLRIAEETIDNRESSLETTRALKEAGTVTQVAVEQTEAQLHSARSLSVEIKRRIRSLENAFSILLGRAPGNVERSALESQSMPADELKTGYPAQLLRNRPDVIAAEYNLVNTFELANVARSAFYPSLNISLAGGLQSGTLDNFFNVNSIFANIAASLTQPLLNGRRIRTQYEIAQTRQEIAYLDFRQSILTASAEVSDAMYSIEAASQRIDLKASEFEAYDAAIEHSEALLNSGFANYLEVLTARQNALNAQLDLIDARFSRLDGTVELYRALGGGWR